MDPRIQKIAATVLHHSLKAKPGEKVMIYAEDDGDQLVEAIVDEAYASGIVPFVSLEQTAIRRAILKGATAEQLELMAKPDVTLMQEMDCHIAISAPHNSSEFSLLSQEQLALYTKHCKSQISRARSRLRWVSLTYPNHGMAQNAGMSLREFSDYYFDLMTMDYEKLEQAALPMALRMRAADKVRIVAPGTDLTVSLKGFTALVAAGEHNLPDGEIASTPERHSVNGTIAFNIPSMHNGFLFKDVCLTFKDGKLVDAKANDTERFLKEVSLDEGCRYIGEFSMGTNPYVTRPVHDTLFDEKMGGSMHMALGACYNFPGRDNGNVSSIHWDLIQSHRPEHGGGEVWLDGELVRKDGIYLPEDLRVLNPDVYLGKD
jgi:aminopeptidase